MEMNEKEKIALVVGATASLAQPLCRMLAMRGFRLVLAGRDRHELDILAADIGVRYGTPCTVIMADFLDSNFSAQTLLDEAGDVTHLILASGEMGSGDIASAGDIAYTMHLNYTVIAQIAALTASRMRERGGGTIMIISSVAGERGRAKIAAYGAAKAALTAFASGLRQAYAMSSVHVLTVKPGFIDTPMTWGMKSQLIASRESAARKILRAMEKKKNVIYVPCFWHVIMLLITHIPERIFKRLSF